MTVDTTGGQNHHGKQIDLCPLKNNVVDPKEHENQNICIFIDHLKGPTKLG